MAARASSAPGCNERPFCEGLPPHGRTAGATESISVHLNKARVGLFAA